jgi:hypothetical protein
MTSHPPRSTWSSLEPAKLYEVRSYLTTIYYDIHKSNPQLSKHYLALVDELSNLIQLRTSQHS